MHKWMTTSETAQALGVTVSTVARMVARGELKPERKLPGRTGAYLFDPVEVERVAQGVATRHVDQVVVS